MSYFTMLKLLLFMSSMLINFYFFSCSVNFSPTLDGPRMAGDGAGDGPTIEHVQGSPAEQKCECHICTAPPIAPEVRFSKHSMQIVNW